MSAPSPADMDIIDLDLAFAQAGPSDPQGVAARRAIARARSLSGRPQPVQAGASQPRRRTMSPRAPTEWLSGRRYAVIVDAGSSGSRMQVYSWKDPRLDKVMKERKGESVKQLPTVEKGTWEGSGKEWQLKIEPGLSSFGSHPQDLSAYLKPLFEHAESIIPPSAIADTPVYVLATAGMRLLPTAQRDAVLAETCRFIKNGTPFKIAGAGIDGGCTEHVQVITGEEEGLLGWIAINYLMDGFHFKADAKAPPTLPGAPEGTKGKATFGFLDMGGASTQIAFEPSKESLELEAQAGAAEKAAVKAAKNELAEVKLRMLDGTDVTHSVFVTTFLGFGTNKARERYVDTLMSNATATSGASALAAPISDPCLPSGLSMPGSTSTPPSSLIGTGSFTSCLSSLHPLLDKEAACARPPCLFHGVHVPKIDFGVNHFIGVSEYWFSSNDVFGLGGVYDFVSYQKAAQEFCKKPWSELDHAYKTGTWGKQVDENRLSMQCFKAAWMTTVLHEGIGLPRLVDHGGKGDGKPHADEAQGKADEKNLIQFQSVNDVNGLAVSWTLGKAVLEASRDIPAPVLPATPEETALLNGAGKGGGVGSISNGIKGVGDSLAGSVAALPPLKAGGHSISGGAALFFLLGIIGLVGLCCVAQLRKASRPASRSRSTFRDLLPPPIGTCGGLLGAGRKGGSSAARGEYMLANRDERFEGSVGGLEGGLDAEAFANGHSRELSASSSEELDPKGATIKVHRSRRGTRSGVARSNASGGGVLSTLFVAPLYRVGSFLGVTGGASRAHRGGSGRLLPLANVASEQNPQQHQLDRLRSSPPTKAGGRISLRRNVSTPALNRMGSPQPFISRPASRTGQHAGGSGGAGMWPMSNVHNGSTASVGVGLGGAGRTPLGSPGLGPSASMPFGAISSSSSYRAASPAPPPGVGLGGGAAAPGALGGGGFYAAWSTSQHGVGLDGSGIVSRSASRGPSRAVSPAFGMRQGAHAMGVDE